MTIYVQLDAFVSSVNAVNRIGYIFGMSRIGRRKFKYFKYENGREYNKEKFG